MQTTDQHARVEHSTTTRRHHEGRVLGHPGFDGRADRRDRAAEENQLAGHRERHRVDARLVRTFGWGIAHPRTEALCTSAPPSATVMWTSPSTTSAGAPGFRRT